MSKRRKGILYSTNTNFEYEYEEVEEETLEKSNQQLEVFLKKYKGGKKAVLIKGFIGKNDDLKSLAKMIKIKCGVGGSAKNGEIIIQGNIREEVMSILKTEGYKYKRIGS